MLQDQFMGNEDELVDGEDEGNWPLNPVVVAVVDE